MQPHLAPKTEFDRLLGLDAPLRARARLFADLCRLNVLGMIQLAGSGHVGSSLSSLDLVSWLHLAVMRPDPDHGWQDVYFSSKGHDSPGLYAVLAALGRLPMELLTRFRRLGGLPGHPDVHTPGIPTNTGSLGMGIAKAKGMILADRLAGRDKRYYVLLGDGELQEGQNWESLGSAANRSMHELTVLVDANAIQSDIWVRLTSDLGDVEAKFRAFGWHAAQVDGHDLEQLDRAISEAKAVTDRPQVIIARTVKGRGASLFQHQAKPDEPALYDFHSGALAPEAYARAYDEILDRLNAACAELGIPGPRLEPQTPAPPAPAFPGTVQKLVAAYSQALVEQGRKHPQLVALDADLKKDCGLLEFEREFPKRFIECGIAEQDMVSTAGGLALSGQLPVVHSFACFLTTRANEQIFNNASEGTKILYVGSLAGLLPAAPGHSHQGVRDIAAMAPMPSMTVAAPCCEAEVGPLLNALLHEVEGPAYMRLFTPPWPVPFALPPDYQVRPGQGAVLRPGDDAMLLGYGPVMLGQAFLAAQILEQEHGLSVGVVNLPWLNLVDEAWLAQVLVGARLVVTLDDHSVTGGLGQLLAPSLQNIHSQTERPATVRALGVRGLPSCGQPREVLARHELDAESVAQRVRTWIKA